MAESMDAVDDSLLDASLHFADEDIEALLSRVVQQPWKKWTEEDMTKIMQNWKYDTDSITYLEERWAHRPSSLPPPNNPSYNVNELVLKRRGRARKNSAAETTCSSLFGDAIYHINKNPETKLRRPAEMLLESDIEKVKDYTVSDMKALVDDEYLQWTKHEHIEQVDLLSLMHNMEGSQPN